MNTKSKVSIIIKTPFASPRISSIDPSLTIFLSTCIVAQYISITLCKYNQNESSTVFLPASL
ncbi:hypothetical protein Syun_015143 [Stephania yunnanensis]|uniref:Uncharacterized protein n=1 Tax=Stephania yunnanensis TaxID=152371 RepID=A0AAP0JMC8_9MAGN